MLQLTTDIHDIDINDIPPSEALPLYIDYLDSLIKEVSNEFCRDQPAHKRLKSESKATDICFSVETVVKSP